MSLFLTNQRHPHYNHGSSSSWCNEMWLELGSNCRSKMNSVQLNWDLIVIGATAP